MRTAKNNNDASLLNERFRMHDTDVLCIKCLRKSVQHVREIAKEKFRTSGAAAAAAVSDGPVADRRILALNGLHSYSPKLENEMVFMDANQEGDVVHSPAPFHVIFRNLQFVDVHRLHSFTQKFSTAGPIVSLSATSAANWCTRGGRVPHVYLQSAIVRTYSAELYNTSCAAINLVFVFNAYPACGRRSSTKGSILSTLTRPCAFSQTVHGWMSQLSVYMEKRRIAQEYCGPSACDDADVTVAQDMTLHLFTKKVCGRLVQADRVDVMWMSSCLNDSSRVRKAKICDAASEKHAIIGRQHCSDLVLRVFWQLPIYMDTLFQHWQAQYDDDKSPPWRVDKQWKMLNVICEQPSVSDTFGVGPIYICLVFLHENHISDARRKDVYKDDNASAATSSNNVLRDVWTRRNSRKRGSTASNDITQKRVRFEGDDAAKKQRVLHNPSI